METSNQLESVGSSANFVCEPVGSRETLDLRENEVCEPVDFCENESLPRCIQTDIGRALYNYNQYDLRMYLGDGDDANEMDSLQKWTPLQFVISQRETCEEYKLEIVRMLLEYGANPYKTNIDEKNALDTARKYGEHRILDAMYNFSP